MQGPGDKTRHDGGFEQGGTNVDPPFALRDGPDLEPGQERCLESGIDVVLVPWAGAQAVPGEPWYYVQLWTDRHIYAFDLALTCIAMLDRRTGVSEKDPQVIGSRLTGGQLIEGKSVKMTYPLPVPGTQAVLEPTQGTRQSFVRTQRLERVIVRLVAVTGGARDKHPTWEAVSGWQSDLRDTDRPRR
jgi:hypothetical protein